jgi:class 3 adenylate cyclase
LEVSGDVVRAVWAVGAVRHVLASDPSATGTSWSCGWSLPLAPVGRARPDRVVAGVVDADGFTELAAVDGRYLSTEVAGGMTGRMVGVVSHRGTVLIRQFDYTGCDDSAVDLH